MKQLLIIFITLLVPLYSFGQSPDAQHIPIVETSDGVNVDGRGLICDAYYFTSASAIQVTLHSVENATVVLFDSLNQIVDSASTSTVNETVYLFLPKPTGCYRLVITAHSFAGVGILNLDS